jgi:Domain of unknown function (DUF5655)
MAGHECYHCKQWVEAGEAHDCWTTTEAALTRGLSEDLQDAYERLRDTAAGLGEQRIYASHNSIMFARKSCYFFVRPKKSALEVCLFLGRPLKSPQVRRSARVSRAKIVHTIYLQHRDEVETPVTDWLKEAYDVSPTLVAPPAGRQPALKKKRVAKNRVAKKRAAKRPTKKGASSRKRSSG